jgi:hypothetical protein
MLSGRVARLERRSLPQPGVPDLWVHVRAFDPGLSRFGIAEIRDGGRVWRRHPGETEDELKARVAAEAPGPYPRLFVCSLREAVPGAAEASTDA